MQLFKFQTDAASEISAKFDAYQKDKLLVKLNKAIPFYQNLSSITGSGKTLTLVDSVTQMRALLPIEPIVLWISKGKIVVEQTLQNLSVGKYSEFLRNFTIKPLLDAEKEEIEDSSKGLILFATAAKFTQKDREQGNRKVFRAEFDFADDSLWEMLKNRWDSQKRKRPFLIVYDEGHNLSDAQTKLLLELNPDSIIAASATTRVPEAMEEIFRRLRQDKGWKDADFSTVVKSSDVVAEGLIKQQIQLGGYVTTMEVAIIDLISDMRRVEKVAIASSLDFRPKAIYVSTTNVVATAVEEDSIKTQFSERKARPIVIWRYLVEKMNIDPREIAVYCNLKFGKDNPPPPDFKLFAGGDTDYQNFISGTYRHIIFNLTLQEGWDDPEVYFAYIDKDMGSQLQVTQVVGRVLRQPHAQHYGDERLNTAHFYVRTDARNVFDEVVQEVQEQLKNTEGVKLTVYRTKTGGDMKPFASIKEEGYVPQIIVNTESAFLPVKAVLETIEDYRQDTVNTVGQGERMTLLQRVGTNDEPTEEWVSVEHSNAVTARWILSKEIQKYYPKALRICSLEEPKFDAKIEYNSLAAENIRRAGVQVVETFLSNSEVVQDWTEPELVPAVTIDPNNVEEYRNALHSGYSGLNDLELKFAAAIDKTGLKWFRNPSRGFFEIPILDRGKTKNFNPDFLIWASKSKLVVIDTKGTHLLMEDAGRKLFFIKRNKGKEILLRLISEHEYTEIGVRKSLKGFTVWLVKNGRITPIPAKTVDEAIQICLKHN